MKKDSFFKVVILLLLLLNAGILIYLWLPHDNRLPGKGPERPERIIIDRLKLDEQQRDQFRQLRDEHHAKMVQIQYETAHLHDSLFHLLQQSPIDTATKSRLLQEIAKNQMQKEEITFQHFEKLRDILRPEQQKLFYDFVADLSKQILRSGEGPPPQGADDARR